MISFPEQLSATRSWQFNAQLDFMRALTAQAFVTAEQVLALNISTSQASVARTADTVRQLFSITDPRDLFSVGSQAQQQWSSLFEYGNELFNIAEDARQNLALRTSSLQSPPPDQEPATQQLAPKAQAGQAPAAPAKETPQARPANKLAVVADEPPAMAPHAKAKPIAKAVRKVAGKGAGLPHPVASPLPAGGEVRLPDLAPLDAIAPSAEVLELKQPRNAPKAQRKK